MVSPADSTLVAIRKKVRRLTASSGESTLTTADLDQYIQTYYSQDFPYSIKLDQMRSVYTFYTQPYVDRYPLDVNYNQGIRSPFYVDGVIGSFSKDRQQFFNTWPKWPSSFQPASGDGSTTAFSFTVPGPFLAGEVTIGTVSTSGAAVSIADSAADGILYLQTPNNQTSVPPITNPNPGMKNLNTGSPGQNVLIAVGSVNYVTGAIAFTLQVGQTPAAGQAIRVRVSQYQTGKPFSLLFWNNEFHVRPVPAQIHKCEIETYLTPIQFLSTTDAPILNQWWQLLAIGAAIKVLEDRQDMDGVANLIPLFDRQESLVLERQSTEEINQRNATIFSSATSSLGWNNGYNSGGFY